MARILIADDHRLTVEGTVKLLWEEWPDLLTAHTVAKAIRMVDRHAPDLILLDLQFHDCHRSGFAVLEHCQQRQLPARVLITSAFADPETVGWARTRKAHGFIGKHQHARDLVGAIRVLLTGGEYWPPPPAPEAATPPLLRLGHRRVLECVAAGMTYPEAAEAIGIAEATVDKYLQEARKRLGARNTTQAVAIAERRGLLLLADVPHRTGRGAGPDSGGGG